MSARTTHQSLVRAISILRVFTEHEPELGVGEIARRLDLHKSTVSRILAVLVDQGLMWHNADTGRYSLGMGLVDLAGVALGQIDVRRAAIPHLERIRSAIDETVMVAVFRGQEVVTVAHLPASQSVRHVVWIGRRMPLQTTASGKVFLAAMRSAGPGESHDGGAAWFGADGSGPLDATASELDQVRQQGFAVEIDEFELGTSALAAPIMDTSGAVVAALSVGAPSFRFGPDEISAAAPLVVEAAQAIAADLGMRQPVVYGGERLG